MSTRRYKLYGAGNGSTQNALAYAQILRKGRIVGAWVSQAFNSVTDNSSQFTELSKQPTNQYTSNDSLGDIATLEYFVNGTSPIGMVNEWIPLDVEVLEGERIYLNLYATGTITSTNSIFLWVQEG